MFRHFLKEDLDAVRSFLKNEDPIWEGMTKLRFNFNMRK